MKKFILLFFVLFNSQAIGTEFLTLSEAYVAAYKYQNYFDTYLDATTNEMAVYGVDLGFDTFLAKNRKNDGIYFNPKIHFIGTGEQVRRGGLIYDIGFRVKSVDLFYHHTSMHVMDVDGAGLHYPLDDHVGIRLRFKH